MQRALTVWNCYTGTTHSGSAHGRHCLPTTPVHRERACATARVKRHVFQITVGLRADSTTTRAGRWEKSPVLDSTLLSTGPYTTDVNTSRIRLVRSLYPRETSSKNLPAHSTGAGCSYGSPAASIYSVWRIANAAGYTLLATPRADILGALQKSSESITRSLQRKQMKNIGRAS